MKLKYQRPFTIAYILLLIGVILSYIYQEPFVESVFKPMLMPCLAIFFIANERESDINTQFFLGALLFSWLGDCFLLYAKVLPGLFLIGLGAFLMAHLCYLLVFQKANYPSIKGAVLQAPPLVLPFLAFGAFLMWLLWGGLTPDMRLPVSLYALVIILMAVFALNRYNRVTSRSFSLVFFGALIFMVSDTMIAIDRFLMPIPYRGIWIMITYALAQYMITVGILDMRKTNTRLQEAAEATV